MAEKYLASENLDDVARMVMALLSEVWIMRDRMAVMERLLEEKVGLRSEEIDDFVPDARFSAEVESLRDKVVGAVVGAPLAAENRSVDAVLRRAGLRDAADRLRERESVAK